MNSFLTSDIWMNFTVLAVIIVFNLVLIECQLRFMERIISCEELRRCNYLTFESDNRKNEYNLQNGITFPVFYDIIQGFPSCSYT